MVAPSKLFEPPINCYHCSQWLLHPGMGCFRYYLINLHKICLSCMKYYLPLLITPLVMKHKHLNRESFLKTVIFYLQAVGWSCLVSSSTFLFICCFRNILGHFNKYTALFIPSVLSAQCCWFFQSRLLKLFTTAMSQAVLEAILRQFPNKLTHLILYSPIVQAILFMLNSALILHYKRKNIYKDYWFIQPYEKIHDSSSTEEQQQQTNIGQEDTKGKTIKCSHINSTCTRFVLEGIKSYLVYGIPLDLFSAAMKSKATQGKQGIMLQCLKIFKKFRPNMTGFFISYVGLYRLSSCLLRKYYNHLPMDLQHLLSAFIGGLSYVCIKRTNFLTLSMVISVQLLWEEFCKRIAITKKNKKTNLVLWLLKNFPFLQMIFSFNIGYLVHNYLLNYHTINSLARGLIDGVTANRLKAIYKLAIDTDVQTIKNVTENTKIRMFL